MAGGGWSDQRSLYERLAPLVGKDRYLVIEKVLTERDFGFGGTITYTVAVTVNGPMSYDELYIYAKRASREAAIEAIESALK